MLKGLIEEAKHKRERLLKQLPESSVCCIPSASLVHESRDADYPFMQTRDFFYLFPHAREEDAFLVLTNLKGERRSLYFGVENDPLRVLWDGERLGLSRAVEEFGVDAAFPANTLDAWLDERVDEIQTLVFPFWHVAMRNRLLTFCDRHRYTRKHHAPERLLDSEGLVSAMRLYKSPEEIKLMKEACRISASGHRAVMRAVKEGASEAQMKAEFEAQILKEGAEGPSFGTIAATGANATSLHYKDCLSVLKKNELFLLDAGAWYGHYAGDITRVYPVNRTFSAPQKAIYEVVLNANKAAIAAVAPGVLRGKIHETAVRETLRGLIKLGILKGTEQELYEQNAHRPYFPHGTSHWLGLDVHDAGPYVTIQGRDIPLAAGMVLTIEPGLYFRADDASVSAEFRGIGIRIEDDVLVTDSGMEVLTQELPKEISEIEHALSSS